MKHFIFYIFNIQIIVTTVKQLVFKVISDNQITYDEKNLSKMSYHPTLDKLVHSYKITFFPLHIYLF